MKKILVLILVTIMALSLVACGGNNSQTETNNSEAETNNEPQLTEQQQMVVNATNQFLGSDIYKDAVGAYEEITGEEARVPKVIHAIDYQLEDFNGYAVDVMLIRLEADVLYGDSVYEDTQLLVDKGSGEICDRITIDEWTKAFDGSCESEEDVYPMLIMCYSFLENNGQMWAEMETLTELTEADLEVINNNLK